LFASIGALLYGVPKGAGEAGDCAEYAKSARASADRAATATETAARTLEQAIGLYKELSIRIATDESQLAQLRSDLREKTDDRITADTAAAVHKAMQEDQDRKRIDLERADEQARRAITALERQIDEIRGKR